MIALNSLMVLPTRGAQRAAFQTLATHLAPGGVAVVDTWIPDADELGRFDGRLSLEWTRLDPATGTTVTKTVAARHQASSATVALTTIFEQGTQGRRARWVREDCSASSRPTNSRRLPRRLGLLSSCWRATTGWDQSAPGASERLCWR